MKPPVGITYYDTENDLFLRKVAEDEDGGSWRVYFPERHEELDDDEALAEYNKVTLIPMGTTAGDFD